MVNRVGERMGKWVWWVSKEEVGRKYITYNKAFKQENIWEYNFGKYLGLDVNIQKSKTKTP